MKNEETMTKIFDKMDSIVKKFYEDTQKIFDEWHKINYSNDSEFKKIMEEQQK